MFNLSTPKALLLLSGLSCSSCTSGTHPALFWIFNWTFINVLKNSSSLLLLISSSQISLTLLALFVSFLKIACLHVSFTAYENFYKLSKMHCLLILFSTFFPSEDQKSETQQSNTYPLIHWFIHP